MIKLTFDPSGVSPRMTVRFDNTQPSLSRLLVNSIIRASDDPSCLSVSFILVSFRSLPQCVWGGANFLNSHSSSPSGLLGEGSGLTFDPNELGHRVANNSVLRIFPREESKANALIA